MAVLVLVEHDGTHIKDATLATVTAAAQLGEVHALVVGNNAEAVAQAAAKIAGVAKVYVANTGRYEVLVAEAAGGTPRGVHVGPHPQDVAVSPDGRKVYATVTGGATGAGGSDVVAVIDTATDQLVRNIHVGTAPRQVVFGRNGARAYVTCDDGIAVIDAAADRVVRWIRDRTPPQGIAVDPAGRTLYVTEPRAGTAPSSIASTSPAWNPPSRRMIARYLSRGVGASGSRLSRSGSGSKTSPGIVSPHIAASVSSVTTTRGTSPDASISMCVIRAASCWVDSSACCSTPPPKCWMLRCARSRWRHQWNRWTSCELSSVRKCSRSGQPSSPSPG